MGRDRSCSTETQLCTIFLSHHRAAANYFTPLKLVLYLSLFEFSYHQRPLTASTPRHHLQGFQSFHTKILAFPVPTSQSLSSHRGALCSLFSVWIRVYNYFGVISLCPVLLQKNYRTNHPKQQWMRKQCHECEEDVSINKTFNMDMYNQLFVSHFLPAVNIGVF